MKIIVLGSNGMAGHVVTWYLKEAGYNVTTVARDNADICIDAGNTTLVNNFLHSHKSDCDFMINCIGYLFPKSIKMPHQAALINAWFPRLLEYALRDRKTKLVHISTDCVYDGKAGPYTESDAPTETNAYGRSKALGEVVNDKDITMRLSIIGPELIKDGSGLLGWVLNNPANELPGWDNAWWNGITTLQLAKCIDLYLKNPVITGLYHVVNNAVSINKYDLLSKINAAFDLNKTIIRTSGPKPVNKILADTRKEFDFKIPDYDTQLSELADYMSV